MLALRQARSTSVACCCNLISANLLGHVYDSLDGPEIGHYVIQYASCRFPLLAMLNRFPYIPIEFLGLEFPRDVGEELQRHFTLSILLGKGYLS